MIKVDIIKHQMEKMDISSYYLWKLTGIGYATINGVLNEDRPVGSLKASNYEAIINALFTPIERMIAERSVWGVQQYEAYYKQTLIQALNSSDVKIYRSGSVGYNENNEPQGVPSHVIIEWGYIDDKAINKACREDMYGRHLHDLRIFDDVMYREMNNKSGQRNKRELVEEYVRALA